MQYHLPVNIHHWRKWWCFPEFLDKFWFSTTYSWACIVRIFPAHAFCLSYDNTFIWMHVPEPLRLHSHACLHEWRLPIGDVVPCFFLFVFWPNRSSIQLQISIWIIQRMCPVEVDPKPCSVPTLEAIYNQSLLGLCGYVQVAMMSVSHATAEATRTRTRTRTRTTTTTDNGSNTVHEKREGSLKQTFEQHAFFVSSTGHFVFVSAWSPWFYLILSCFPLFRKVGTKKMTDWISWTPMRWPAIWPWYLSFRCFWAHLVIHWFWCCSIVGLPGMDVMLRSYLQELVSSATLSGSLEKPDWRNSQGVARCDLLSSEGINRSRWSAMKLYKITSCSMADLAADSVGVFFNEKAAKKASRDSDIQEAFPKSIWHKWIQPRKWISKSMNHQTLHLLVDFWLWVTFSKLLVLKSAL